MRQKYFILVMIAVLFAATADIAAQEGTNSWEFVTGGPVTSAPAIGADGAIYFGSMDGRIYAVNPDGTKRWEFATQAGISSSPTIDADGNIYVGSLDSKFYSLAANGTLRWSFQTSGQINSSPALAPDGTIYFGSLDQNLYALDRSGGKKWQFSTGGGIFSSPAVAEEGTIYVGSRDNKLYAINPDGTRKWDVTTGFWVDSSPAIGPGGRIYVGSRDARMYAFEKTGQKVWEFLTGGSVYSSPALAPDGTIYVGSLDGKFHALNPDGTERWSSLTGNRIVYSSPAVAADGTVYVGSQDNNFYAFNSDGTPKWRFASPGSFDSASATIGQDGTVYVGAANGKLYAVKGSAGPAGGPWPMFRRDPRHTASGFVVRVLPLNYFAGAKLSVALHCIPPSNSVFYAVQDKPPANWTVGAISDGGVFDASSQSVKFGPFLDGKERLLTYEVIPPATESGGKQFVATSFLGNGEALVGGDQIVAPLPLHPADNLVDGWMTIGEITGYGAAWKTGNTWPVPPNPIPLNFLNRALSLWKNGEIYSVNTNIGPAPVWWFNITPDKANRSLPHLPVAAADSISNGAAQSALTETYLPTIPVLVTITVNPATNVIVYAAEDQPPPNWTVSQISDGGGWDTVQKKVKWGPFFDHSVRTLSYQVTPPSNATNDAQFNGIAAFDGATVLVGGRRHIRSPAHQTAFVERQLPASYSPQASILVGLEVRPPPGTGFYVIEDAPPPSWQIGAVNNNGTFDSANKVVRFGPFFDDLPRTLTYAVIPPADFSGTASFIGSVSTTEETGIPVAGDDRLDLVQLHPADDTPADRWMSIGEMTAYGAAWKDGVAWPLPPNPIPPSYLEKAIALWQGGEEYRVDSSQTNAPAGWVNLSSGDFSTNRYPGGAIPTASSTNTSAVATMPEIIQPGVPLTITITVTPESTVATYAVEDVPPANWVVSQISDQGFYDLHRQKVKWGPFFDATARTLTYQATPPANANDAAEFAGLAAFDDATELIGGQRSSAPGAISNPALDMPQILAGGIVGLTVTGTSGETYLIEASTNLNQWTPISTGLSGNKSFQDLQATNFTQRFYRVTVPRMATGVE